MRVALIHTDADSWGLGVRALSAFVREDGHQSRLILIGGGPATLAHGALCALRDLVNDADVVGISCLARGADRAVEVIAALRPLNRPIVWGGIHASLEPEQCARWADVVCRGEGEGMLLEFLERLERHEAWRDMPNIAYCDGNRLALNPLRPLIPHLDVLPLPDFTCDDEYRLISDTLVRIRSLTDAPSNQEIPFTGARGCAFSCTYCCNARLKEMYSGNGRFVRRMSMPRYIEQCASLLRHHPADHYPYFHLLDEDFLARTADELRVFAQEFPKRVGRPFQCMGSPVRASTEKIDLLVQAGMWRLHLGVESGSERTKRQVYHRKVPNHAVAKAVETAVSRPDLTTCLFLILGNPYESDDDLAQTVRFLLSLEPGFQLRTYSLVFFPGSLLYERALSDQVIHGALDSGCTSDFLGGYDPDPYPWKRTSAYLNTVLYLMEGKSSPFRMGFLPRPIVALMLRPTAIRWGNSSLPLVRRLAHLKQRFVNVRSRLGQMLRRIVGGAHRLHRPYGALRQWMRGF